MQGLSEAIVEVIIDEYGVEELLARLSDPYWFQSLGCVLGFDWHSSGVTTVVTGVLKSVLRPEKHGVAVAGGKGRESAKALFEIAVLGRKFNLSEEQVRNLQYASKLSAKVDNSAIQAGYPLYHHTFFLEREGKWIIIQQGMNVSERTARRYHWNSGHINSFVIEPHDAIVGDKKHEQVLNMTAQESEGARHVAVDVVNDGIERLRRLINLAPTNQMTLTSWMGSPESEVLRMPWRINWKALKKAYEIRPRKYEELLAIRGIGPATVRGLALVSEAIYGEKPSWRDPVKFSFAYGGKDRVPFPINRRAMDQSIQFLMEALESARVGDRSRLKAFSRLSHLTSKLPI